MTADKTPLAIPSVSVTYARTGASARPNALGMRPMQERAYEAAATVESKVRRFIGKILRERNPNPNSAAPPPPWREQTTSNP